MPGEALKAKAFFGQALRPRGGGLPGITHWARGGGWVHPPLKDGSSPWTMLGRIYRCRASLFDNIFDSETLSKNIPNFIDFWMRSWKYFASQNDVKINAKINK